MKILGMDFTSAPTRRKPITLAVCAFNGEVLCVLNVQALHDFAAFEAVLAEDGPWIAGIDFPFGQPRRLVENLGWPKKWTGYVEHVALLGKQGFEGAIRAYSAARPPGDKQHRRAVDVVANSRSPMMLAGVPVGKMFFQGAPRLLAAPCSIVPLRPTAGSRVIVEAYPALVARRWTAGQGYKSDDRRKQNEAKTAARRAIIAGLQSPALAQAYGFSLELPMNLAERMVLEHSADSVDAVLCAVQAAWAFGRRNEGFGIPAGCDLLEGWIVDPVLG